MNNTKYKIETGIPVHLGRRGSVGQYQFPVEQLKVGESFFVPTKDKGYKLVAASCYYIAKKQTQPFKIKVSNIKGGTRVWRIK